MFELINLYDNFEVIKVNTLQFLIFIIILFLLNFLILNILYF